MQIWYFIQQVNIKLIKTDSYIFINLQNTIYKNLSSLNFQ